MTKSKKEAKIMFHKELLNEYMNLLLNMSGT
ncbi:MarR family transcriptional regulator, partial [Bacillus wiedmannii]